MYFGSSYFKMVSVIFVAYERTKLGFIRRDSVVSKVTDYGLDGWDSILDSIRIFYFCPPPPPPSLVVAPFLGLLLREILGPHSGDSSLVRRN